MCRWGEDAFKVAIGRRHAGARVLAILNEEVRTGCVRATRISVRVHLARTFGSLPGVPPRPCTRPVPAALCLIARVDGQACGQCSAGGGARRRTRRS